MTEINQSIVPAAAKKPSRDLDEALEETFPASDPIAYTPMRAGKEDKKVDSQSPEGAPSFFQRVFGRRRT